MEIPGVEEFASFSVQEGAEDAGIQLDLGLVLDALCPKIGFVFQIEKSHPRFVVKAKIADIEPLSCRAEPEVNPVKDDPAGDEPFGAEVTRDLSGESYQFAAKGREVEVSLGLDLGWSEENCLTEAGIGYEHSNQARQIDG